MSDFFAMGGYAAFVWPAFGFAALVLLGLLAQSWWAARRRAAELEQLRRIVRPRGQPAAAAATGGPARRPGSPRCRRPAGERADASA